MSEQQTPYTFDRVVRMTLTAAGAVALFLLLRHLADVLLPFAAAAVLAYLLNPLVNAFEQRTGRRWAAVGITLSLTLVVGFVLAVTVIVFTARQYDNFAATLDKLRADLKAADFTSPTAELGTLSEPRPRHEEQVEGPSNGLESRADPTEAQRSPADPAEAQRSPDEPPEAVEDVGGSPGGLQSEVRVESEGLVFGGREVFDAWREYRTTADAVPQAQRRQRFWTRLNATILGKAVIAGVEYDGYGELAVKALGKLARGGWTVLTAGVNLVLGFTVLVVVALYLVFLLLDYPQYAQAAREFLPPKYRGAIVEFASEFEVAMRRYFRGQSLVALITGVLFMIGFSIVGLPLAVPFGLFVGLLNIVPYLQAVALLPAGLLAVLRAVEHDSSLLWSLALVLLVFAVVQLIQDGLVTPRIMSGATGLRPVAILLGVFIWGKLLGFLGLLLAIPLTCLGIAYYRRLVLKHSPETTTLSTD